MSKQHLTVYLNDHFAGGVAALELLTQLRRTHPDRRVVEIVSALEIEITADHEVLASVRRQAGLPNQPMRQAIAWMSGKATELKLRLDDPTDGPLRFLEMFELLSVGVEGKRLLWRCLAEESRTLPILQVADFEGLIQRAEAQRQTLEPLRLAAARDAFGSMT